MPVIHFSFVERISYYGPRIHSLNLDSRSIYHIILLKVTALCFNVGSGKFCPGYFQSKMHLMEEPEKATKTKHHLHNTRSKRPLQTTTKQHHGLSKF